MLEVSGIVKEYRLPGQQPIRVLDGVSFAVAAGEHVAIVGRSGAGKTTLLNILGGLDKPTAGDVVLGGGIPAKNRLIVQLYADVLDRRIWLSESGQACALGSAILGAAAAMPEKDGKVETLVRRLARRQETVYTPDPSQAARYDRLYQEYITLLDCFGRGQNNVMKHLKALSEGVTD